MAFRKHDLVLSSNTAHLAVNEATEICLCSNFGR